MAGKYVKGFLGAVYYSGALQASLMMVDKEQLGWQNYQNIFIFCAGFIFPTGLVWSRVNQYVQGLMGIKQGFYVASFSNKKALAADLLLNHILYQSLVCYGVYYFLDYQDNFNKVRESNIQNQIQKSLKDKKENKIIKLEVESNNKQTDLIKDLIPSETKQIKTNLQQDFNSLFWIRAKISLVSIVWDIWFPQISMKKVVTQSLEFTPKVRMIQLIKNLFVQLVWHSSIFYTYLHCTPFKQLSKKIEDSEIQKPQQEK